VVGQFGASTIALTRFTGVGVQNAGMAMWSMLVAPGNR
jgi:hypothetical protein